MFWISIFIIVFVVLIAVMIVIYTMPSDTTPKPKKKAKELKAQMIADSIAQAEANKDWKVISERWERQNNGLLGDIEKLKMQQKEQDKNYEVQKEQVEDLLEKLSQEKGWREKEQANLDKVRAHEKELKEQIYQTEADLEKEHSTRIRQDQQLVEFKIKFDSLQEEKRTLSTKAMSLETTLEQANRELVMLRQQNTELSRKKEDIQWVAKTEFDELKKQLQQNQQEITRLKASGSTS
ncbi:MAG: hypothetical protein WCH62_07755 [Candidatus Omnitrophota bacterium]